MSNERMCALCGVKPAASKIGRATRCLECRERERAPLCGRCLERPALKQRGVRRCAECRLLCTHCDEPRAAHSSYCAEHRIASGKARLQLLKTCKDCGKEFRSKAAHDYCNACRYQRMKRPCADCGTPIDHRATRCMKCWGASHSGEKAHNWRGGRSVMKVHGYVLVRSPPGHPTQPYVREHIHVVEQRIGRYLLPGESVHHKNGQRDDNRDENLELWVKSQPSGQRAEDLLAWAKEIIERYG